ncbi:MAG: septation protein SpoVG family protein [Parasporobacterium sp.]|nr:septation protein SpoVG family protein [Parasporobacterium sp.]
MNITSVRIRKLEDNKTIKAYASVVIDDSIAINRVRVLEGRNGLFVSLPALKGADGQYRDIAHPVTSEGRKQLNQAVLDAYEKVKENELAQGFESLFQDGYEFKVVPGTDEVERESSQEAPPFRAEAGTEPAAVKEKTKPGKEKSEMQRPDPKQSSERSSIKSQLKEAEKACASQPSKPNKEVPSLG